MELLLPCGGMESLAPACRMGADAVYLGSTRFSARRSAGNFDDEALKEAVRYCHERGVKVHLAVNTLMRDTELQNALSLCEFAAKLPVDALIVQDLGLAALLRKAAPSLPLHASTQMSVHTPKGAELLMKMGFSRAVLARELSREEIREIRQSCGIELEVFVHGALCMSVSGQCYLSAMLGGRSGNRGACAQPCRLPFLAPGGTGHDLSLKDLSIIPYLKELEAMGIESAKVEGRMKRPEYVAAAAAACLSALEDEDALPRRMETLQKVFSRSGFTEGYYTGSRGRDMFGVRQKDDVTAATGELLSSIRQEYKDERPRVALTGSFSMKAGEKAALTLCDGDGNQAGALGGIPEKALARPLDEARARSQLSKTGGTPYYFEKLTMELDEGLILPASELNRLRRAALSALSEKRGKAKPVSFSIEQPSSLSPHKAASAPKWRAHFREAAQVTSPERFELCYVPLTTPERELERLLQGGARVGVELPRGLFGREEEALALCGRAKKAGVRDAWVGNLGALPIAQQAGLLPHGGYSLNVANTEALAMAETLGFCDCELSMELTLSQTAALSGNLPRGLMAYGRLPLMLLRNCPGKNGQGCAACKGFGSLIDRKGIAFPYACVFSCSELYNSLPLSLSDRQGEISGVEFISFRFTVENSVEIEESLQLFHSREGRKGGVTRGLCYRGVD